MSQPTWDEPAMTLDAVAALYESAMQTYPHRPSWEQHEATDWLRSLPELTTGRVLSVGAGCGFMESWLLAAHPALTIDAVEPSPAGIARGQAEIPPELLARLAFHRALAADLPFATATFDAAFSSHALEHIADLAPVLAAVRRVLKPGAPFFVAVPEGHHCDTATHCHWWTLAEFEAEFTAFGAAVTAALDPRADHYQILARLQFVP